MKTQCVLINFTFTTSLMVICTVHISCLKKLTYTFFKDVTVVQLTTLVSGKTICPILRFINM
jgi:hypothetical protein